MDLNRVFAKISANNVLLREDIISLLEIDINSSDFYTLLYYSNRYCRDNFGGEGYVFAQIGINAQPCSVNCRFCSMGKNHYSINTQFKKSKEDILREAAQAVSEGISDLFIMTTADYSLVELSSIGREVKKLLNSSHKLVANVGDFSEEGAKLLKDAGFTGVYHIVRLREGEHTDVSVQMRLDSINAAQKVGLELYYCVEPIGAEHTYDEIATEILRAQELKIDVMAVMRRVGVKGTPLADQGMISNRELVKIAAVSVLAVKPKRSMNVHETTELAIAAGINQLYGEYGANPRDLTGETSNNRGLTIAGVRRILQDGGWNC